MSPTFKSSNVLKLHHKFIKTMDLMLKKAMSTVILEIGIIVFRLLVVNLIIYPYVLKILEVY